MQKVQDLILLSMVTHIIMLQMKDITIQPVDGVYKFSNVTIYEGTLTNFNFTYASTDADFRFRIT